MVRLTTVVGPTSGEASSSGVWNSEPCPPSPVYEPVTGEEVPVSGTAGDEAFA